MLKYERFAAVGCTHGNKIDPTARKAFFDFLGFWKPKHRFHLGDIWNIDCLRKGASEEEKLGLDLEDDLTAGSDFIRRYRPTRVLLGNHDHRAIRAMRSPKAETKALGETVWARMLDSMRGVQPVPYHKRDGVFRFGDRALIHGYASGVYAVRKQTLIYGSMWSAHLHTVEQTTTERHDQAEGRCIGTLGLLDQDYNETHLMSLRQVHGFLYGVKFANGKTLAWQAQAYGGVWLYPSEMKEVKCA